MPVQKKSGNFLNYPCQYNLSENNQQGLICDKTQQTNTNN